MVKKKIKFDKGTLECLVFLSRKPGHEQNYQAMLQKNLLGEALTLVDHGLVKRIEYPENNLDARQSGSCYLITPLGMKYLSRIITLANKIKY